MFVASCSQQGMADSRFHVLRSQAVLSGGIKGEGEEVRAVCCHSLAMYRGMRLQALVTIFVLHADNRGSEVTDQDVARKKNKRQVACSDIRWLAANAQLELFGRLCPLHHTFR